MALPEAKQHAGFPSCISLSIEFNRHAVYYETAAQWLQNLVDIGQEPNWISDEDKQKAIETESVWVCHWYPTTPIGSYTVAASSFDVLMAFVNQVRQ